MNRYISAFIISTITACLTGTPLFAQTDSPSNVLDLKHSITDSAIVFPESFEVDTQKLLESWFIKNYTATDDRFATENDAFVTDEVIIQRLSDLPTVIEMPYNQIVRSYIDKYTKEQRSQIPIVLGLGLYYNPIFEQALEAKGLPLELKYLPVIESSLDPNAVSKHGAAGLWQFMLATAKGLGMEVNSLVDERRDPYISSEMAASYLKGLYDSYGDWSLAIAAYNCGPGTLNKAIRRAGGDPKSHDFWSLYNFLPEETRGYLPGFIAVNYVLNYYPQHNISPVLPTAPLVMDTIHIQDRIHFQQISEVLKIPVEELRVLNPQYRADIIPGSPQNPRNLILPSQQIHAYLMSEEDIKNYEPEKYGLRGTVDPGETPTDALVAVEDTEIWAEPSNASNVGTGQPQTIIHKVKAGETLASIAQTYEVTPEEIKKSNGLSRNAVRVGQQLRITTTAPIALMENTVASVTSKGSSSSNTPKAKKPEAEKKPATTPTASTHLVKRGETLSKIAVKYGVTVAALKSANNLSSDNIREGQKLKIPAKKTAARTPAKSASKKRKR
ncbi:MAG: LysM peptidoglycan-binding domain-containing protein [Muribaculaceae bacterium]|nr:LysM peptidoglycan-binding domain-containing protein [Muribaculaceae bacterium]